jgi:RNAse (barnase) inhibitor barstar
MAAINAFQELIDLDKVIGLDVLQDQKTDLLKDIQGRLKNIGVYGGDLDELYDLITERALIRFCNTVFLDNLKTRLLGV